MDIYELIWETAHCLRYRTVDFSLYVPVVGSIWLSMVSSLPEVIFRSIVAVVSFDGELDALAKLVVNLRKLILRQAEDYGNRLDLSNDE